MIYIIIQGRKDEADIQKMIQRVMEFNSNLSEDRRITISMEFERPREALIPLMSLPDVVSELMTQYNVTIVNESVKTHLICTSYYTHSMNHNFSSG